MKEASLICEIVVILVQMFHTYWIMEYGSGLRKTAKLGKWTVYPKAIQAWLFCGVLDVAFLFSMLDEMYYYAFGFIAVLTYINILFVYNHVQDQKANKKNDVSLRRQVVKYSNVLIINACMVVFAHIYTLN